MKSNENPTTICVCKSVFKSGENTTSKQQFTGAWIKLINRIEKGKNLKVARK